MEIPPPWAEEDSVHDSDDDEAPLSESPKIEGHALEMDYLQAALYYSVSSDKTTYGRRYGMLWCATALVALQIALMQNFFFSVESRACTSSEDCVRGTSCTGFRRRRRASNVCRACARLDGGNETKRIEDECFEIFDDPDLLRKYRHNDAPWPRVTYDDVYITNEKSGSRRVTYRPKTFLELCSGCIDGDGAFRNLGQITRQNFRAMRLGDFATLLVCAVAVGLILVAELREVKTCNIAQSRSLALAGPGRRRFAHVWFAYVTAVRGYVLIPLVVAAVPRLVVLEGANTVSVVFNTVSVIFVTELDNLVTQRFLSPQTVAVLNNRTQVIASREDLRYFAITPKLFVAGVVAVIFLGLIAEVRYNQLSFALAVGLVYVEGVAELLVYDGQQPFLTRILVTACVGVPDDDDDRKRNPSDDPASSGQGAESYHRRRTWWLQNFNGVASPRRRRRKASGWNILPDLVVFTIEFYVVIGATIGFLNEVFRAPLYLLWGGQGWNARGEDKRGVLQL